MAEFLGMPIVVHQHWPPERFELVASPASPIEAAAWLMGASRADIPGLWNVPGYPELTTGQLLSVASNLAASASKG